MTACRRKAFEGLTLSDCANPGLAFYRFLKSQEEGEKKDVPELLQTLMTFGAPELYKGAFKRWERTLGTLGVQPLEAKCSTPLAIGLGSESPIEVGMTFQHTYGMPMIPGSALKGLVRRALFASGNGQAAEEMLGKQEQAGACVFFDAWYDPNSVNGKPFHRDVVTVHHPEYYRTRGGTPPTDFDDPTPVPFLVVRPGAQFQIAVLTPSKDWHAFITGALDWALENLGVGARTNAGYGRMRLLSAQPVANAIGEGEQWGPLDLTFDPGRQEIKTRQADKTGSARLSDLEKQIPPSVLESLKGKTREARASVTVVPVGGKNYKIVAIHEANEQ